MATAADNPTHSALRWRARGKINLHLRVLRRRDDGFHDIQTWMQPLDWHDELTIRPAASGDEMRLICEPPGWPTGDDNLVVIAARRLAAMTGRSAGVAIHLVKHLPLGGGLGGGSADAAATLLGLARMWGLSRDDPRIVAVAEAVGADVPFFLSRGAAVAGGRGTELRPMPRPFAGWAALVLPPFGVPTGPVYARCRPEDISADEAMPWATSWRSAAELSERLLNDLMPAAFAVEPRLAALRAMLDGVGGVRVHMSGSGSTLFALFDGEADAERWCDSAAAECRRALAADAAPPPRFRPVRILDEPACVPLD